MKKFVSLTLVMMLLAIAASAQVRNNRCGTSRITAVERNEIKRDIARTRTIQRIAKRDGIVTPRERLIIGRSKAETRRDIVRSTFNRRNRF